MIPYEIPVIMYHSISNHPNAHPLGCIAFSVDEFVGHLEYLRDAGYEIVSVKEVVERACAGRLGRRRTAVLTFDDGFLDNLLIAVEILKDFGATATLFVNPNHTADGAVRTLDEHPQAWGILNFDELRVLEKQGTFDVQSHTMSHDFNFVSDRLIDLYTPEKFTRYYWLAWKLDPSTRTSWHGDVYRFAASIPSGYPIFEWGRCMQAREFSPSQDFVELCVEQFKNPRRGSFEALSRYPTKGTFESEPAYEQRIEWELKQSKLVLEQRLSKHIDTVCFPGDAYDARMLSHAAAAGYTVYMRHPREQGGNNRAALLSAADTRANGRMIGLRRLGIFHEFPKFLPQKAMGYWATRIAVRAFIGVPGYTHFLAAGRVSKKMVKALFR